MRVDGYFVYRAPTPLAFARMQHFVVLPALFRIAEDLIGLGNFLESFFGALVSGVQIRMVFAREALVDFANLLRTRFAVHAQRLIEVVCHRAIFPGVTASPRKKKSGVRIEHRRDGFGWLAKRSVSSSEFRLLPSDYLFFFSSSTSTYSASMTSPSFLPPEEPSVVSLAPSPEVGPGWALAC